ncbi:MAG: carboxypeptidase-like regulatory domain-containing protein [Planctomycetota bacterium]|nr:carboxypeptidase-like regulatory domain-containing protein [Planctomycetota bacterium]
MSRVAFLALVALVSATAGCGDPTSQVTGTVTMDGSPAAGLVVAFVPKSGGTPNAATTDSSGSYSLVASPGSYKVSISSQQTADTPDTAVDEDNAPYDENSGSGSDGYEALAQGDNYKDAAQFKETVPAKYNQNSELTADLVAGENKDVNFTLTSE